MNWMLALFILLTVVVIVAWLGKYKTSIVLYVAFLLCATVVFVQLLTVQLVLQL